MIKYRLFLFLIANMCFFDAFAQIKVSGRVTSSDDKLSLPGVSVKVKGSDIATSTNSEGRYSLNVAKGATLQFTSIGFQTKELLANDGLLDVELVSSMSNLNEVVIIGYGTQKRKEQTAAISTISSTDLLKAPVADVTNSIVGRVAGVFAVQKSGSPGANAADIFIRGRASANASALIVVDGVERQSFGDIDANEIESVSFLKDASSTALFGIKGANGVIIVTTKSGKVGKPVVSYSGSTGLLKYSTIPDFLNAADGTMLHNEGEDNLIKYGLVDPSFKKLFSPEELAIFKSGTGDPLLYPNVNWYKAVVRPSWFRTQHNLNFSGGSKVAKYFVSTGYLFEDGMFKDFKTPLGYRTTPSYTRYNFRSNLDLNLTKTTKFGMRLGGRLEKKYSIQTNAGGDLRDRISTGPEYLLTRIYSQPAWAVPFFPQYTNPTTPEQQKLDNTLNQIEDQGRLGVNTFNPYAVMKTRGYVDFDNNAIENVFTLDQKLDVLTTGLAFKATFGYDAYVTGVRGQQGDYAAYSVNKATKELSVTRNSFDDVLGGVNTGRFGYLKTNLQLALNYNRTFNDHTVTAVAVAQRELRSVEGAVAPFANQGLVLRTTYNYNNRYFFEINGSYNGSENYPANERYGLFPAVSAGWTLSNEKFMKDVKWLDNLKFRGSYGLIGFGNVGGSRFLFLDEYSNGGGGAQTNGGLTSPNQQVLFGNPGSAAGNNVVWHSRSGNPNVTWEKSVKRNLGIDAAVFNNNLTITADLFDERRYDILLARNSSAPNIFGESFPLSNYGENTNKGYEFEIGYNKRAANLSYGVNITYTHAKNEQVIVDEPINQPASLKVSGTSIGQNRGYKVLGFYQSLEDIKNSPESKVGSKVIPGDFKFADTNGDNIINDQDRVAIGYSDLPQNNFGLSPTVTFKRFTLSALVQGANKVNTAVVFSGRTSSNQLGRWTPETVATATFPSLRAFQSNPSYSFNDFLMQDASYVKLRNVELSYSFAPALLKRVNVKSLNVIFTGQNLYTWTKFNGLDPENIQSTATSNTFFSGPNNSIPITRVYNLGVNIQF